MSRKNMNIQNKLTIIDQQSIGKYLQELNVDKNTVPLTPDMENQLFVQYKLSGDKAIKERLIKANLRWVVTIAKQFSYPKARLEDIINEGNIGMIKAIDKFDPTRGTSFLTFATWYIRQEITSYINDTLADVAQPANRYRINRVIAKAEAILRAKGNDNPTAHDLIELYMAIKENTDPVLSIADYNEIKMQSKGFVSMETQLPGVDGEEMNLAGTFKSGNDFAPDYEIKVADKKYEINQLLNACLSGREKEIVEYSFGLNTREEKTLDQVSEIIGLTRERVGQLLQGSLVKLKEHKSKVRELCGTEKDVIHAEAAQYTKD
jgi:RNA polymerase primary sigma factor